MEAIVYCRWSTKNQEDGDSLNRQLNAAREVAKQRGWTIIEEHVESGKSAYHGRNRAVNGKLRALEDRAERGELAGKLLLVEAMDRLSRQEPLESLNLLMDLCKRGLTIYEFGSGTTYTVEKINENWGNLVVALAKAGEAYESSRIKAQRVSSAWRITQEAGRTKEGNDDPRLCPAWMEVVNGRYSVIEERADVIREMFRMALNGHGLRKIAGKANEARAQMGWPKAPWHIRSVSAMLHGRRVLGEYQPQMRTKQGRTDASPARQIYPPIITLEQWHQVQSSIATRRDTGGPREKTVNVLSHVCRCTHRNIIPGTNEVSAVACGSRMSIRTHKRQRWQLVCADFARAGDCKGNATFIYEYLLNGLLDNIADFAAAAPAMPQDDIHASIAIMRAELETKRQRLDALADDFIESGDPVLKRAYDKFKAKVFTEAEELHRLENSRERKVSEMPSEEATRELATLRSRMDEQEARLRMQVLIDGLVDAIFLHEEDKSATVVLMGGLMAFRLDKQGRLIAQADALHMLDQPSNVINALNPASGRLEPWTHNMHEIAGGRDPLRSLAIKRAARQVREQRTKRRTSTPT